MSLSDILTGILSDDSDDGAGVDGSDEEYDAGDSAVVYECRECGVTVSEDTTRCPSCDARAIAEYPVE